MLQIRPVSDLRNKFSEIENIVSTNRHPVFLTKNGYGSMVVMSLDLYESLTDNIEARLDEADFQSESSDKRLSHEEVFSNLRSKIKTAR
ncbi:MAG: type II toxin-antitoxin system Phd/YefM family antitoxin [Treponema sp.]|nr:type II toxin-antitoxin system Phd/YefM family antitoxin [Treponema sp.]